MNNTTFIYTLIDPNTQHIRYVGKANNPHARYHRHITTAITHGKTYRICRWISSLFNKNQKPVLSIIEECATDKWKERESYWINHYRGIYDLTNCKGGGDGLDFISDGTRKKMSDAKLGTKLHAGFKHSEEAKKKMSESAKRKFSNMTSEERKSYTFQAQRKPVVVTDATKRLLSELAKERLKNPIYQKQVKDSQRLAAAAMKEKVYTDSERLTISQSHKNRWANTTDEQRKAIGAKISLTKRAQNANTMKVILENPNLIGKQLAEIANVSVMTIYRTKKLIKNEQNKVS